VLNQEIRGQGLKSITFQGGEDIDPEKTDHKTGCYRTLGEKQGSTKRKLQPKEAHQRRKKKRAVLRARAVWSTKEKQ